jgi:hypothetical protein
LDCPVAYPHDACRRIGAMIWINRHPHRLGRQGLGVATPPSYMSALRRVLTPGDSCGTTMTICRDGQDFRPGERLQVTR